MQFDKFIRMAVRSSGYFFMIFFIFAHYIPAAVRSPGYFIMSSKTFFSSQKGTRREVRPL